MTSLLSALCCCCCCCRTNRNVEHKVLLLGLENAGKTSLLYKWVTQSQVETVPTIGYNVESVRWKDLNFLMWDIGGQAALRPAWGSYYPDAKVVIIVVDSTDADTLPVLKYELENIVAHEDLATAAFLIMANKQDEPSALNPTEIAKKLDLDILDQKSRVWKLQPCSAKTGFGMPEALQWMTSVIR